MEENFWHSYLSFHQNPATRILHYIATACFFVSAVSALIFATLWHLFFGLILALMLTELSHRLIEGRPSMLRSHPFCCLICAVRMSLSALTGHISEEITPENTAKKP